MSTLNCGYGTLYNLFGVKLSIDVINGSITVNDSEEVVKYNLNLIKEILQDGLMSEGMIRYLFLKNSV